MKVGHNFDEDFKAWIENAIKSFVNDSPENSLMNAKNERAWEEPVVGFSNGDDPLYRFYKENIGNFYWTPLEIFTRTFPQTEVSTDQLAVISWILPQAKATKSENRKQTWYPSERWARARFYGEQFNDKLRKHTVETLQKGGSKAVAPTISPLWEIKKSRQYGLASTWSERHAAYASGLGTFGLCDGLITPKGKAVRCGSVVAKIKHAYKPSKRPYDDHHAYCLFFSKAICGKCIKRCPVGAISKKGHDKDKCLKHLREARDYFTPKHELKRVGCGLCQTGVPCESKIPTKKEISD